MRGHMSSALSAGLAGKRPRQSSADGTVVAAGGSAANTPTPTRAPAKKKATKKTSNAATTLTTVTVRRPKLIWRTRDQENSMLYNLQLDVGGLQSELQGLRAYRELLMNRALNREDDLDGSLVRTVREYFRVFRHGYASDAQLHHPQYQHMLPHSRDSEDIATPDEFLRHVMDEHVLIGRFPGLAQMMKQWALYSSLFGPMSLSFLDSHIISSFRGPREGNERVLVTSRAQYQLYISLRTIEIMFPHVLAHQEIVTKILGRRITGIGKFDFEFDLERSRIVRYEFSLDLTSSFIDLLGDPAMVALLLNDALISDEFFIGDLSEFVPETPADPSSVSIVERGDTKSSEHVVPSGQETSMSRPWKMTLSSILSPAEDEDNQVGDGEDALEMEDWEPYGERSPDDNVDDGHDLLELQLRIEGGLTPR